MIYAKDVVLGIACFCLIYILSYIPHGLVSAIAAPRALFDWSQNIGFLSLGLHLWYLCTNFPVSAFFTLSSVLLMIRFASSWLTFTTSVVVSMLIMHYWGLISFYYEHSSSFEYDNYRSLVPPIYQILLVLICCYIANHWGIFKRQKPLSDEPSSSIMGVVICALTLTAYVTSITLSLAILLGNMITGGEELWITQSVLDYISFIYLLGLIVVPGIFIVGLPAVVVLLKVERFSLLSLSVVGLIGAVTFTLLWFSHYPPYSSHIIYASIGGVVASIVFFKSYMYFKRYGIRV